MNVRMAPERRLATALAIGCALGFLLGAVPLGVLAHANLDQSRPTADQALAGPPDEVWMSFTEAADGAGTGLAVLDGSGTRVDLGNAALSPDGRQATVGLGPLGPGVYTVAWHSHSADDGDDAKGFFAFAVGAPTAPPIMHLQGPLGANPGRAEAGGLAISLAARPGAGPRTLVVALAAGGQPVVDAQRVWLRLSSARLDLGTGVVEAAPQADGRYLATTWLPSLPGNWQAEVRVRRAGFDDVAATLELHSEHHP